MTKKPLILIVDDNPQNLQVLGSMLKEHGYKPAAAQNGNKAIDFVQKKAPDLILLDIMMPGMDGIEVCRRFKAEESTKDIPIIFITALSEIKDKLKAFAIGGVDYITKPFITEEVLARINVHIKLREALEKIVRVSITDEMTGVFNRRFAYEILTKQIANTKRTKENFIICYVDIDNLKKINDTYGHAEGDLLINLVVESLKKITRDSDYIFRMGGDEFLLIFPRIQLHDFNNLINRIKQQLNKEEIHNQPIDFSFGFAEFDYKQQHISADELINIADTGMYESKLQKKSQKNV
ncbi:diguanylate cyclase [Candidatus Halobeggiatoa sp. HSG11]|nr:diguanylate cyclase [Candidatus Halobeggiatoa sp. HSG11]